MTTAAVAAWVDGEPLAVDEVDERLARLRDADGAGVLPEEASREGRQLRRWVTQVMVVERLCAEVSKEYGGADDRQEAGTPTRADAVALGSIAAAAWAADPAVRRAAWAVTAQVRLEDDVLARAGALGGPWSADELLVSARLEAFARWLAAATYHRVRLAEGYEHPGDSSQPDNLHRH